MKSINLVLTIYIIIIFSIKGNCQLLSQKDNLNEISRDFQSIYQGQERVSGYPKYKHLARWQYWWSSRVNPDGSFNDVSKKNNDALVAWNKTSTSQRASEANWIFIGPEESTYASNGSFCRANGYGRVDRIDFHPTNANKLYASTPSGGAWYSDDLGSSWSCLTDNLPIMGCSGVVVDPADDDILYLLTGTTDNSLTDIVGSFGYRSPSIGILKSFDHGENWETMLDFDTIVPGIAVIPYRLKMHPLDNDVMFAATSAGLFRSEDRGANWVRELIQARVDIEFHPTDENFIYTSGFNRMHYSSNKGESWISSNNNPGCNGTRIEIAVSPDSPDNVWLVAGGVVDTSSFCGYSKSTDKGINFSNGITTPNIIGYKNNDQSNYDLCIAVDNNNDQRVVVGGIQMFKTENYDSSPNSWNLIAPYSESLGSQQGTLPSNYVHPDIHDLAFNPLNGSLYACTDGGIYRSNSNGNTWVNITPGIHVSQIFHLNLAPSNSGKMSIGHQDNGMKIRYSSNSEDFKHVNSGDGFEPSFHSGNSLRVASSINNSVYLYPNTNTSVRNELTTNTNDPWFQPVKFKYGDPNMVYRGEQNLMRSSISGDTLSSTSLLNSWASWEILTCPEDPTIVYSAGGTNTFRNDASGRFYYYKEGSGSFNRSNVNGFPNNQELVKITGIATFPGDCDRVAFTNGGFSDGEKVYYSSNKGSGSWQNFSYNLPNVPVHSIKIDANGNFYVGTDIGVFYLLDNTTTWLPFYNNMPRVPVTDLEISNNGSYLYAATFGRGVWQSFLPNTCSASIGIANDLEGNNFFQASNSIISDQEVIGGVGTTVNFHAGNKITLRPGFKAHINSRFKAVLTPCGTAPDGN